MEMEIMPVARMQAQEAGEERVFPTGSESSIFMARSPRDQKAFFRRAGFEVQGGNAGAWRLEESDIGARERTGLWLDVPILFQTRWPAHSSSNAPRLLGNWDESRNQEERQIAQA